MYNLNNWKSLVYKNKRLEEFKSNIVFIMLIKVMQMNIFLVRAQIYLIVDVVYLSKSLIISFKQYVYVERKLNFMVIL